MGILLFASFIALMHARRYFPYSARLLPGRERKMEAAIGRLILRSSEDEWRTVYSDRETSGKCQLFVENGLDEPLLLCWINSEGQLLGYRKINDRSIKDKSVTIVHVEYTYVGHSFVCMRYTDSPPKTLSDVPSSLFVFHFSPKIVESVHRVLVQPPTSWLCFSSNELEVSCTVEPIESDVIDSSCKQYEKMDFSGFTVYCEPGVFDSTPTLRDNLSLDISTMCRLLPVHARYSLQQSTPIWLNKTLRYGPKSNPVDERKAMFHPVDGVVWLKNNGLSVEKAGSVEICNADDYIQCRGYWGPGGLLLHEFSHAYHNKFCPEGYDCPDVIQAFKTAMQKRLYEKVKVHGPQGANGPIKHYACTNHMEFFAELSVALHWKEDDQEYNKWFPFNFMQLLSHDRETCFALEKLWNV